MFEKLALMRKRTEDKQSPAMSLACFLLFLSNPQVENETDQYLNNERKDLQLVPLGIFQTNKRYTSSLPRDKVIKPIFSTERKMLILTIN